MILRWWKQYRKYDISDQIMSYTSFNIWTININHIWSPRVFVYIRIYAISRKCLILFQMYNTTSLYWLANWAKRATGTTARKLPNVTIISKKLSHQNSCLTQKLIWPDRGWELSVLAHTLHAKRPISNLIFPNVWAWLGLIFNVL